MDNLAKFQTLMVRQRHEIAEWIGFETRNKYEILDSSGNSIGFAAEQQKGFFGFVLRQWLGHWRSYEIHIFDINRQLQFVARHPFRFLFPRIELFDRGGKKIGALQGRFTLFSKRFQVENEVGAITMEVSSPLWRPWNFPFHRHGQEIASVQKKWSGTLTEMLTDRDTFLIQFKNSTLTEKERQLIIAAALFIDLRYFETKAKK